MPAGLPVTSMPTNPGGVVDPDELVGRDREIRQVLDAVDTGGAKLLGDRRMGKTSLLGAVVPVLRERGHHVIRVSAETSDPSEFGRRLLAELRSERLLHRQLPDWLRPRSGRVELSIGVASFALSVDSDVRRAPVDLFATCAAAAERAGAGRVIFVLDEITALAKAMGSDAEGLFQTLRTPRQIFANVSVIMAGSIGLHHVLSDMAAVNDIPSVAVGPLTSTNAQYLARCLLRGAAIAGEREEEIATAIAAECSFVPFYVHKLVERLVQLGMLSPTPFDISRLVEAVLADPDDVWEMQHYLGRLDSYYGPDAALVGHVLDLFATAPAVLTVDQVLGGLAAADLDAADRPARTELVQLIDRLEKDHYLLRIGTGDRFATPLLQRSWRAMRRLP